MRYLLNRFVAILFSGLLLGASLTAQETQAFEWPNGNTIAVSLTWDDSRRSQVIVGTPLLDAHDVKATFYVLPQRVEADLEGWQAAVRSGHEIGNHSLRHPCSGNFLWTQDNALEAYSLDKMNDELAEANNQLTDLLGVTPTEFAYPCGQTFVGRGANTKSYVPIVENQFATGRTWLDEVPNDPTFCDMAQLTGVEMDGKNIGQILELIAFTKESGGWLILAGHEIGNKSPQTTEVSMLNELLPYLNDPSNKIWTAPVGEIAAYVKTQRGE